jgi:sugar phosphate isomerase/epimerase
VPGGPRPTRIRPRWSRPRRAARLADQDADRHFTGIRKKFDAAGLKIYGFNYSFNPSFTDEEIDRGFEIAKALGAEIITASTTLPVAQKVAPFAEKHKMIVAMHGHSNLTDPNEFATPRASPPP